MNESSELRASSSHLDVVPQAETWYSDGNHDGHLPDLGVDSNEIDSFDSDPPASQSEYEQIMGALQDLLPDEDLSDEELVEQSALEHEDGTVHIISHTDLISKTSDYSDYQRQLEEEELTQGVPEESAPRAQDEWYPWPDKIVRFSVVHKFCCSHQYPELFS